MGPAPATACCNAADWGVTGAIAIVKTPSRVSSPTVVSVLCLETLGC